MFDLLMIKEQQNRPKMGKKLVWRGGEFIARCFLYLIFMVSGATLRPGGWLNKKADDWAAPAYYQPYLARPTTKAHQLHQHSVTL